MIDTSNLSWDDAVDAITAQAIPEEQMREELILAGISSQATGLILAMKFDGYKGEGREGEA